METQRVFDISRETNYTLMSAPLDAILLPKVVSVEKCEAHISFTDLISTGNAAVDAAVDAAASSELFLLLLSVIS